MKYIIISVAAIALAAIIFTACRGPKHYNADNRQNLAAKGKALIVFFSHPGDNTKVGNIEVGNTKIVADYISEITGADQFEVQTTKDYNMSYRDLCRLSKKE